jgi:hypothetical protein
METVNEHALRERAYFVAGVPAKIRERSPLVESAIEDAIAYIGALPENIDEPTLSGGKRTAADKIITFHWLVQTNGKIKAVTIAFLGNGLCDASWPDPFGDDRETKSITVAEALALNLPEKVHRFRDRSRATK